MKEEDVIICRCMEITEKEVREAIRIAIDMGSIHLLDQAKKLTSAGMGLCQGRTCKQLIERLVYDELGKRSELPLISIRPPIKPLRLKALSEMENDQIQ